MLKRLTTFDSFKHKENKSWNATEKEKRIAAQVLCQLAKVPVLFHINNPQNTPQLFFKPISPAIIEPPLSYPVYYPKVIRINRVE